MAVHVLPVDVLLADMLLVSPLGQGLSAGVLRQRPGAGGGWHRGRHRGLLPDPAQQCCPHAPEQGPEVDSFTGWQCLIHTTVDSLH